MMLRQLLPRSDGEQLGLASGERRLDLERSENNLELFGQGWQDGFFGNTRIYYSLP